MSPSADRRLVPTVALAGAVLLASLAPAAAETLVVRGATVHPVAGPDVEDATLVVRDGIILALGTDLEVPSRAVVVDLAGLHLYPGFLHPTTALGLTEIGSVAGSRDTTEIGRINTHLRAEVAFNGDSMHLPVAMSGGVLTALVIPWGGDFTGTSALVRLDGWNWQDMTLRAPVGMHLRYPSVRPPTRGFRRPTQEEVDKERKEALAAIDEALEEARVYGRALEAAADGRAPSPETNPRLAALLPVLAGDLPLFLHADERGQIADALDWAERQEIPRIVLVAGADARYLAQRLSEGGVPVILTGVLAEPARDWEPYDAVYSAAASLHEAGVRFAIGDAGFAFAASAVRNLPFHAAMAAAFGLPRDVALRSVTLSPAEILGVGDRLGSLEPGKEATMIATDGDPLEIRTHILRAWIAGREVDLEADRQKQLYRKYEARPKPGSDATP